MICRINEQLYCGTVDEIDNIDNVLGRGVSILGACKEPLHRQNAKLAGAETEGYIGKAMPKEEPEYLWAEREHALYCNLIDAPDPKYIPDLIIKKCMDFIREEISRGQTVLVVCNKGESRSPSICLMWLIYSGIVELDTKITADDVINLFTRIYCPSYNPGKGFKEYTMSFIDEWAIRREQNNG